MRLYPPLANTRPATASTRTSTARDFNRWSRSQYGCKRPMGGSSGPVYRENLQVAFALFRIGRFKPVLDTYVLERASANVSDTLLPAMDHEANRVDHELKKH